jgi:glycosyltransferase involved in cell wall biosynthesis
MITSRIKIFVDENEFDFDDRGYEAGENFKLNAETSVSKLKQHFFGVLEGLGELVRYSTVDATLDSELARALSSPDTLIACFHEAPPNLPCRLLQHTKGGLMLTGGFLGKWTFDHPATVSIVTSAHQADRLTKSFRHLPVRFFPLNPTIDSHFFEGGFVGSPEDAGRQTNQLIYAGRWIANKGLCQLIRGMNRWNCGVKTLEMIGEFEQGFQISQSGGTHVNYPAFHAREAIERNQSLQIRATPSMSPAKLAVHFHKATAFAYPSFHEDENYGLAPREAAACGAIPIVTDWCGLGEFGKNACGGLVRTWATLGGVRFSLKEMSKEVARIVSWPVEKKQNAFELNRHLVRSECSGANSLQQMTQALETLLALTPAPPPSGGWRCSSRLERLVSHGPPSFRNIPLHRSSSDPEGLYVDGLGYNEQNYSEAKLLTAIQGLYTTWPAPPEVRPGIRLHGFWRLGLWHDECVLVEFGFPGPRLLRFSNSDWRVVSAAAKPLSQGDFAFEIRSSRAAEVFQRAIELGYLVPDFPMECKMPEPNCESF